MSDVFREVDEEYRQEQLLLFLKRHAPAIIIGLLLAIAVAGGISWYKADKRHKAEAQTFILSNAIDAAAKLDGKPADAAAVLTGALADKTPGKALTGGRRIAAEFAAAHYEAAAKNIPGATSLYDAIAGDKAASETDRNLAKLNSLTLQVDSGDPAVIKPEIDALANGATPWRFSARELQAILAIRLKDYEGARTILSGLANDAGAPDGLKRRAASMAEIAPVTQSAPAVK